MKLLGIVLIVVVTAVPLILLGFWLYTEQIANPRIARELVEQPDGERARKVMLVTLPSGRSIPVNYLREGDRIYAGADGTWWKELAGQGGRVSVVVRGETLSGLARAVRDDPVHTKQVFARLRPNAIEGFGTLVEIELDTAPAQP